MPCYDSRDSDDRDAAARAGCEMAKVLDAHPELMAELTLSTRRWIQAHQEFDRKKNRIKCIYCGHWNLQAYKGSCPNCPRRRTK